MKKFRVLAAILSAGAIASTAIFTSTNVQGCPFSKSTYGSGSTIVVPGSGTDKMNFWNAHKGLIGFGFLAAVLGAGAGYMSYRAGQEVKAACAGLADNFDVNGPEEGWGEEVWEHPEAPGGQFDLLAKPAVEVGNELAHKEVAIAQSRS